MADSISSDSEGSSGCFYSTSESNYSSTESNNSRLPLSFHDKVNQFLTTLRHNIPPTKQKKPSKDFSFTQINLQHSKVATTNLVQHLQLQTPFIALIQEPWIHGNKIMGLGPQIISHSGSQSPRSAIIHSRGFQIWNIPELTDRDITTCSWNTGSSNSTLNEIILISGYWDIHSPGLPTTLNKAITHCQDNNIPFICSLDSNAHSTLWGCGISNERGTILEDYLIELGVNLLNKGNESTFSSPVGSSIIDITFTSSILEPFLKNWHISKIPSFSDHKYLIFQLHFDFTFGVKTRPLSKCDWTKFQNALEDYDRPPFFWSNLTIESEIYLLYEKITKALNLACPTITIKPKHQFTWWTEELEESKKRLRRLFHLVTRVDRAKYWEEYVTVKHDYKQLIKKTKRKSWQTFTSQTTSITAMAKLVKILKSQQNRNSIGILNNSDGNPTTSIKNSIELLLDTHFPESSPIPNSLPKDTPKIRPTIPKDFPWITVSKIKEAIQTFGPFKAPGPDELKPIILQHLPDTIIERLALIFRACITNSYTPRLWRTSNTIFIPKLMKDTYSSPRSFRPISLTPFLFKTLEKLIYWEVESNILSKFPLNPSQHAFRKDYGTDTALSSVVSRIEKATHSRQYTLAVFLDIEGAFDNITIDALLNGLQHHKLPEILIKWFNHYLRNRFNTTKIGNIQVSRKLERGTSQGGISSPLIYNFNNDILLDKLPKGPVNNTTFADDLEFDISGPDPETLVSIMQTTINQVIQWASESGFKISTSKTKAILFTPNNKKLPHLPHVTLYDSPIDYVDEIKYLGLTITKRLSWTPHLSQKIKKCKTLLLLVRKAIGSFWGPSPKLTLWAYTGVVRPCLTYASHIWGQSIKDQKILQKLTSLQRLALTKLGPVRDKTPTAGLEIITHIKPIDLFIKETALNTVQRLKPLLHIRWDGLSQLKKIGHLRYYQNILETYKIWHLPQDILKTTINRNQNYFVDIKIPHEESTSGFRIYTDGSKSGSYAGLGVVIYPPGISTNTPPSISYKESLGQLITVFQAELLAILRACELIQPILPKRRQTITLYSDCLSALKSIQKTLIKSSLIFQ